MLDLSASKQSCPLPLGPPTSARRSHRSHEAGGPRPGPRCPQTTRDKLCFLFIFFLWSVLHSFVAALAGCWGEGGRGGASSWRPPSNTLRLIKTRRVHIPPLNPPTPHTTPAAPTSLAPQTVSAPCHPSPVSPLSIG